MKRPSLSAQMLLHAHHFVAYMGGAVVVGGWYEKNWWVAVGAAFVSSMMAARIGSKVISKSRAEAGPDEAAVEQAVARESKPTVQSQLAELRRHPVGSREGYNAAWRMTMDDPDTLLDQCDDAKPHRPHLFRMFPNSWQPDVDPRMRRCEGVAVNPDADRHHAFSD